MTGIIELPINAVAVENRLKLYQPYRMKITMLLKRVKVVYVEESGFRSVSRKEQFGGGDRGEDSIVVAENVPVRLSDVTRSVTYEPLNGGDIGLNNR